jgi:hypothetical protein
MANQEIQPNPNNQDNRVPRRRHFSIFWPLLLITAGVLVFLSNIGVVQGGGWDLVLRLWPLLLIVGGLDGLLRREGMVGAVLLVGLGVIFLLSNLGYLALSAWEVIVRFWPVFLVALGLDILIGRRRPWAPIVGVLVGLLLVCGIVFLVTAAPGVTNQRSEAVNFTLNDVTQANGSITMAVGRLDMSSGAATGALMDGDLRLGVLGAIHKTDPTGSPASFSLSADNSTYVSFGVNDTDHWSLHLNPAVTYSLNTTMGVGEAVLNLADLSVSTLDINMAVGRSEIRLPIKGSVNGSIKSAVGETVIIVPHGALVRITVDTGLAGVNFPADYTRSGNLVSSPAGQTDGPTVNLSVNQALGAVSIRYLP